MVKLKRIQMTDEELREKKLHLEFCNINKNESDLSLLELEEHLDKKLRTRLLDDDIAKITEDIEKKIIYDAYGKEVPATEADIDQMKITLEKFIRTKELDLPSRKLRNSINKLRDAKLRPNAPELQIKKLEREIREKAYDIVDDGKNPSMID